MPTMSRFHGLDKGLLVALKTEILEKLLACEIHISALGNETLSQDDVLDMATGMSNSSLLFGVFG
jgi:hypothetical protein